MDEWMDAMDHGESIYPDRIQYIWYTGEDDKLYPLPVDRDALIQRNQRIARELTGQELSIADLYQLEMMGQLDLLNLTAHNEKYQWRVKRRVADRKMIGAN